jgi:hypothetical protein
MDLKPATRILNGRGTWYLIWAIRNRSDSTGVIFQSNRDRRRRRPGGRNFVDEPSLPGDSEHHTPVLQAAWWGRPREHEGCILTDGYGAESPSDGEVRLERQPKPQWEIPGDIGANSADYVAEALPLGL